MVVVDDDYKKHIAAARNELKKHITDNDCAPVMLRLAFHDAGTYNASTNKGGVNGSIRFELNNQGNERLQFGHDIVAKVKMNHPKLTWADLYQLGGVVAVEATRGPAIHFDPGRDDAPANQQDQAGTLPSPFHNAPQLKDIFNRMGLSDKEVVVLSGAHTLGGSRVQGFAGTFTHNHRQFDNSYYKELLKGNTPGLVQLPSDRALLQEPALKSWVEKYAKDQNLFFHDYAEAHKKMSELGFRRSK